MSNQATHLLTPPPGVMRTIFLYVGQGESTLLLIPDGNGNYLNVLIDINTSVELGGVDVVKLLEDYLPRKKNNKPTLDLFINTHPHSDHIRGLDHMADRIHVLNIWHTGFNPSKSHKDIHKHLEKLIKTVRKENGGVYEYDGTRTNYKLGASIVNIVSPAKYLKDEIDKLDDSQRDSKIHEYCGVLRFGYGTEMKHILVTGDSDKAAWQEHITNYHKERITANILSASHHGSRSFFKDDEDDKIPYKDHIKLINPNWIVVSSPVQKDSPHDHPHDDAMKIYNESVQMENLFILGEGKNCAIYDIYEEGTDILNLDAGEIVEYYPMKSDDSSNGGNGKKVVIPPPTRIDSGREMGIVG